MESGPRFADALKALWIKFLPQMQERVAVLEGANRSLNIGALSPEEQSAAAAAAHKLAGVLGTFGLAEGTELAREAEELYTSPTGLPQDAVQRLDSIAQRLSAMIQVNP